MDKLDKILKDNLISKVDNNFSKETMNIIRKKQKHQRIVMGVFLLLICSFGITFIPFESIKINNLPYIEKTIVISKLYVFIGFTFTILIFFDTLFRSFILSNQFKSTTN